MDILSSYSDKNVLAEPKSVKKKSKKKHPPSSPKNNCQFFLLEGISLFQARVFFLI